MVPKWVRGTPEFAYIETAPGLTTNVPICALGGSVATPLGGTKANVVEVKGLEELKTLGEANIKGKIVFYNRPMDPTLISTFDAYSGCCRSTLFGCGRGCQIWGRGRHRAVDEPAFGRFSAYGLDELW